MKESFRYFVRNLIPRTKGDWIFFIIFAAVFLTIEWYLQKWFS